jgi:hypothetical protein
LHRIRCGYGIKKTHNEVGFFLHKHKMAFGKKYAATVLIEFAAHKKIGQGRGEAGAAGRECGLTSIAEARCAKRRTSTTTGKS